MSLQQVLQRADVWRGSQAPTTEAIPSGFAELDRLLPGGGWPRGALTEIEAPHHGVGEMRLLLPALARLSCGDRWIVFVAPPHIPFAPPFVAAGVDLSRLLIVHPRSHADELWAVESGLRSSACAAVLAWTKDVNAGHLRRWQLAAEAGGSCGILFQRRLVVSSPAALRLQIAGKEKGKLEMRIVKRRGGWSTGPVPLEVDHAVVMRAPAESSARHLPSRYAG